MRILILIVAIVFWSKGFMNAQSEGDTFVCDKESFNLLKDLSDSRLKKGDIYLFTTTHQDLGWLNHIDACTIDRDTLWLTPFLKCLEEDPTFKMDIEQTSILREYIHRHPESYPLFVKYMKEGRICVGGTFIQPYEEMYSGESLARQFYLGTLWLKQNFEGYQTSSYFNVDVPGRTLQMPQIMKKAGVENLIISRHERGLFYWEAPDGSKVRTYTPGHYIYFYNVLGKEYTDFVKELANESVLWYTKYNDVKKAETVMPAMLNYEFIWDMKPVRNCPTYIKNWNNIRYIEDQESGKKVKVSLPQFKYATADNFFETLDRSTSSLPVISGERPNVWLYIHGPSHENAITASRAGDVLLPAAEKMASYSAMYKKSFHAYPKEMLDNAWEAKIYPDHGWGGNGGIMTDNIFLRKYEFALSEAERLVDEQANFLASFVKTSKQKGRPIVLFNNLSYVRTAPVVVPVSFEPGFACGLQVLNNKGMNVDSQLSGVSYYPDGTIKKADLHFVPEDVPAMGLKTYYLAPATEKKMAFDPSTGLIENEYYRIELVNGGIKQIYDKVLHTALLNTDKFLGGEVITMRSVGNGAGEFDAVQQPDMEGFDKTSNHKQSWKLVENGSVYTSFKMRTPIRDAVVEQTLKVYHKMKKIDMEVGLLNWNAVLYREYRLMWPIAFKQSSVSYEVPFGALTVGKDEMPGAAGERYYVENSKQHPRGIGNWLSVAGEKCAVTLSSSVAVADYIDPTDQPVDYTILQPVLLASRKSCHGQGNEYIQPGDHFYKFSLTSHEPQGKEREEFGVSSNEPLIVVYNPVRYENATLPEEFSFVSIDNPNVKVTAVKKSESDDSLIIRMYNCSDKEEIVNLHLAINPKEIIHTNLIEEELNPVRQIVLGKYAIETYKIKF
jgi:alpha-mannosidase